MAEDLTITTSLSKEQKYQELYPQIKALVNGETDVVANLANLSAAIKEVFGFLWVGFYLVKDDELVLGPFQGPVACTRIKKGKGVCGKSWEDNKTLIVPDVNQFDGHIACSSLSQSEIVIPLTNNKKEVVGVLDVDSKDLNTFDTIDEQYLKLIIALIDFQ